MELDRLQELAGITEKSSSEKQARFMAAAAHNPEFAKKAGIKQSVAKEFNKADTGTKQLSNAMKEDPVSEMVHKRHRPLIDAVKGILKDLDYDPNMGVSDLRQVVAHNLNMDPNDSEFRGAFGAALSQNFNEEAMDEKAPPGMEDMVLKLKKEYPGDESKAFATAWSIYNKKHGDVKEEIADESLYTSGSLESIPAALKDEAIGIFNQASRTNGNPLWAIDSVLNTLLKTNKISSTDELRKFLWDYVDKHAGQARKDKGKGGIVRRGSFYEEDMDNMESEFGINNGGAGDYSPEVQEALEHFRQYLASFVEPHVAYETVVQHLENQGVGQEVIDEFDYALKEEGFAANEGDTDIDDDFGVTDADALASAGFGTDEDYGFSSDDMEESVDKTDEDALDIEENYDLNNGYGDIHDASANDYFPTGADSPVVTAIGNNPKQGDNPEQKRMAVAEVQKELVSAYRKFLKEN